ncbi:MAG: alkaline phosphatase family protein, partial [Sphingomicrobium sp.]
MHKLLLALAALASPAIAAPPTLLIVISVDQLSGDLFDQYRPHFTGGLARLAGGTVFRNGYQSHAASETCPGHSTILTGDRPARTGIVANVWFDANAPRADKAVYCAEDERAPGTTSTAYKVSPVHLRVTTFGDLLKRASPASRTIAIGGKDRSAVMLGGAAPDQRWYWDGKQFATDLATIPVPRSVTATNAALASALAAPADGPEITPLCAAKAQVFPIAGGGKPVGNGTLARAAGANSAFRATPQFDAALLALAAGLIHEQSLGRGAAPDLLA